MKFISVLLSAIFALQSVAQAAVPVHGFTESQNEAMAKANQEAASNLFLNDLFAKNFGWSKAQEPARLPFAEYGKAGYLLFSDNNDFNSAPAKLLMAKNLPEDMTLVVFTGNADKAYQKDLFNQYAKKIDKSRLKVIYLPTGERGFWARDGVPVPAWTLDAAGNKKFSVVDARYYHNFEADKEIGEFFGADVVQHNYYYEGGNFVANSLGDCVAVDNDRVVKIPDSIFETKYGCKTLLRMPFTKGIGHIDETAKFMTDDTLISDDTQYTMLLEEQGFKVVRMPRPNNAFETYVNALIVNGKAFVPVFNQPQDVEAIKVYESFGLKVIPLNSISLSNDGMGSIHCITMVYPPVPFNELLESIGAEDVQP